MRHFGTVFAIGFAAVATKSDIGVHGGIVKQAYAKVFVGLGIMCVSGLVGCTAPDHDDSSQAFGAQGAGLIAPPPANRFVGTQHPSALGPLWYQVQNGTPALDRIVVTPAEQLAQARLIFDTGPSSYMIDYEGKVNDIAVIAQLVEYATPGLQLHDAVYDSVNAALFADIDQKKVTQPEVFGDFPVTRSWDPVVTRKTPNGYLLGWWYQDFKNGRYQAPADESLRREIYVRLPEPLGKGGFKRDVVIKEIARINYRYIQHLYQQYRRRYPNVRAPNIRCGNPQPNGGSAAHGDAPPLQLRNAIVRLIDPQTQISIEKSTFTFQDEVRQINLDYDRAFKELVAAYDGTPFAADAELKQALFPDLESDVSTLPVQAVALLEEPETVVFGADWLRFYLNEFYAPRYRTLPPSVLLFMAGSDLNRITGAIPGEYMRSILINRLHALQREYPNVHIMPWIGSGGTAVRSGPGTLVESAQGSYFKEQSGPGGEHALLNVGIARTFQPDHLEAASRFVAANEVGAGKQPGAEAIAHVYDAAKSLTSTGILTQFGQEEENRRIIWTGLLLFTHIDRINRYAGPLSNLRTLLERHNQVGRVKSGGGSAVDAGRPEEAAYGRDWPQVYGYLNQVLNNDAHGFDPSQWSAGDGTNLRNALGQLLSVLQERLTANKSWTRSTKSTRAINDAFGRYILGSPLTTVHGIGATIRLLDKIPDPHEIYSLVNQDGVDTTSAFLNAFSLLPMGTRPIDQFIAVIRRETGIGTDRATNDPYGVLYENIPIEVQNLWKYYIRNDGFTVLRSNKPDEDEDLIRERIMVSFPFGSPDVNAIIEIMRDKVPQLGVTNYSTFTEKLYQEYQNDIDALEDFIARTMPKNQDGGVCRIYQPCSGVDLDDAAQYRKKIHDLINNQDFQNAMKGVKLEDAHWRALFKDYIVPLLAIPGWNRIG